MTDPVSTSPGLAEQATRERLAGRDDVSGKQVREEIAAAALSDMKWESQIKSEMRGRIAQGLGNPRDPETTNSIISLVELAARGDYKALDGWRFAENGEGRCF